MAKLLKELTKLAEEQDNRYYLSLFSSNEKVKDIGVYPSLDKALYAVERDFLQSAQDDEEELEYQMEIFDRDMGDFFSYQNHNGQHIWETGTDEIAYIVKLNGYAELEDLS